MMVPLNGSTLREFDAAIVVGADAEHLPSRPVDALFFANSVRSELGLQTREHRQRQQLREFASLLMSCSEVVLSWQAKRDGEDAAPSPWIQRLELTLEMAGGLRLPRHQPQMRTERITPSPSAKPQPSAASLLPARLSASGYNSLVACPYQFFASRMLSLAAAEDIAELPERRDYGDWLHKILKQYHDAVSEQHPAFDERHALMAAISDAVFEEILSSHPAALGFQSRWLVKRDAYVDWANQHEQKGWQFAFGETRQEQTLHWDGGSVRLHGTLDRVDRDANGELMVLDYKTTKKTGLKKRIERHEDHQLPFYALLLDPEPAQAAYVAIDEDQPDLVPAGDLAPWRDALQLQLKSNLSAIAQGAALPASGVGKSCEWCSMRGLCRKGAW